MLVSTLGMLSAQDAVKSGPQPGTVLPAAFDAFNINGKVAPGREHCPICESALNPAVLIFTREPAAKTEKPLTVLLEGLDKLFAKHESAALGGFAVFLSPDARSSSIGASEATDTDKLLEEATKRLELFGRLKKRAEPLKHLVIAAYPEAGPKGYNINPKAEVTIVFYSNLKVIANWAFAKEQLAENDVGAILKKVAEDVQIMASKK
jgi:hypothetical protein